MTYIEKIKFYTSKILESKAEYRRIKQAKALGIKNPYKHFINILPSNLQKITKIKAG